MDELERAVGQLGGEVTQDFLSDTDSRYAKQDLQNALGNLKSSIKSPEEKLIIYCGTHAYQMSAPPNHECGGLRMCLRCDGRLSSLTLVS